MGRALATMDSVGAGRDQFDWRRWPVAVAKVGRWPALCAMLIT